MYSGNDGHASQRARIESQSHRDAGQPAHRSQPDDPGAPAKALTMSVALGGNLPPIVARSADPSFERIARRGPARWRGLEWSDKQETDALAQFGLLPCDRAATLGERKRASTEAAPPFPAS